jgi:hypothetical protein
MVIDSQMANSMNPGDREPVAEDASSDEFEEVLETGACDDAGVAIDCKVLLPTMGETKNCFVGTQVCLDAGWSSCVDDEVALEMMNP